MSNSWPKDKIRELFALAEAEGESKATLASPREAALFRFALYTFRRREGLGHNLSILLDDNCVVLSKKNIVPVVITQAENRSY